MTDGQAAPDRRPARLDLRAVLRDVGRTVASADLALAYCVTVTAVSLVVLLGPHSEVILERLSGNVENLLSDPLVSQLASALVVETVPGLVLVAPLLVALAYLQRFVGRLASLVVGLAGHVGAGLVVAAGLSNGIFRGLVDEQLAEATDVGVSYVLASTTGFLVLAVPRRWRWWYIGAVAAFWLVPAAFTRTFTDAGHVSALVIGLLLALVAARTVAADRRARAPQS